MRHTQSDTGIEHIISHEVAGMEYTACGEKAIGAAEVDTPHIAAQVADNLCENCRDAMDEEMALLEMADEA